MESITESITMKNRRNFLNQNHAIIHLVPFSCVEFSAFTALGPLFFLKNIFTSGIADKKARVSLFLKIMKIQTSLETLKHLYLKIHFLNIFNIETQFLRDKNYYGLED